MAKIIFTIALDPEVFALIEKIENRSKFIQDLLISTLSCPKPENFDLIFKNFTEEQIAYLKETSEKHRDKILGRLSYFNNVNGLTLKLSEFKQLLEGVKNGTI